MYSLQFIHLLVWTNMQHLCLELSWLGDGISSQHLTIAVNTVLFWPWNGTVWVKLNRIASYVSKDLQYWYLNLGAHHLAFVEWSSLPFHLTFLYTKLWPFGYPILSLYKLEWISHGPQAKTPIWVHLKILDIWLILNLKILWTFLAHDSSLGWTSLLKAWLLCCIKSFITSSFFSPTSMC